jgi:hypothetical protein
MELQTNHQNSKRLKTLDGTAAKPLLKSILSKVDAQLASLAKKKEEKLQTLISDQKLVMEYKYDDPIIVISLVPSVIPSKQPNPKLVQTFEEFVQN